MTAPVGVAARSRALDLARAGAAPAACGLIVIVLLATWVVGGGGGAVSRVRISVIQAWVPMVSHAASRAEGRNVPVYLTLRNLTGNEDVLVSASSPAAARVVVTRQVTRNPAAAGGGLAIPARSTVRLTPFGGDLVLIDPRPLVSGQDVLLRLRFRDAGVLTVEAGVKPPGGP